MTSQSLAKTIEVPMGRRQWVARITGTSHEYGLGREFIHGVRDYTSRRWIRITYDLADGLYEINADTSRYFALVSSGAYERITAEQATALAQEM